MEETLRRIRRPVLVAVLMLIACGKGDGRRAPGYWDAIVPVEDFMWQEVMGYRTKALELLGECDVDQSSDTTFAVIRGQNFWRVASHDTVLVMVEYDAVGIMLPKRVSPNGRDTTFTFTPQVGRLGETFAVTWDSSGKKTKLVCGLHHANHQRFQRFKRGQFDSADGSRARWDSTLASVTSPFGWLSP